MGKIVEFKIPENMRRYSEPEDFFVDMESFEFDLRSTLGPIGKMIHDHKHMVLNWLHYGDFLKPFKDWQTLTKETVVKQKMSFNNALEKKVKDIPVELLGGEKALLKRAVFKIRDIEDERQEVARVVGIVSEVLYLEGIIYHPASMTWMKVEDYQIKKAEFPKIRECKKK